MPAYFSHTMHGGAAPYGLPLGHKSTSMMMCTHEIEVERAKDKQAMAVKHTCITGLQTPQALEYEARLMLRASQPTSPAQWLGETQRLFKLYPVPMHAYFFSSGKVAGQKAGCIPLSAHLCHENALSRTLSIVVKNAGQTRALPGSSTLAECNDLATAIQCLDIKFDVFTKLTAGRAPPETYAGVHGAHAAGRWGHVTGAHAEADINIAAALLGGMLHVCSH